MRSKRALPAANIVFNTLMFVHSTVNQRDVAAFAFAIIAAIWTWAFFNAACAATGGEG